MSNPDIFSTDIGCSPQNSYLHPSGYDYPKPAAGQHLLSWLPPQVYPSQVDWRLYPERHSRLLYQDPLCCSPPSLQSTPVLLNDPHHSPVQFLSPPPLSVADLPSQRCNISVKSCGTSLFNANCYVFDPSTTIGIQQLEQIIMNRPVPSIFLGQYNGQAEKSLEDDGENLSEIPTRDHSHIEGELIIHMGCGSCKTFCVTEEELICHRNRYNHLL